MGQGKPTENCQTGNRKMPSYFDASETQTLTKGEQAKLNQLTEMLLETSSEFRRIVDTAKAAAADAFNSSDLSESGIHRMYVKALKIFDDERAKQPETPAERIRKICVGCDCTFVPSGEQSICNRCK